MEPILLAVIFLRLIIPLAIFRWPLPGAIAAMIIDAVDYPIFLHTIGVPSFYIVYDKLLDTYYLTIEAIVCLRWMAFQKIVGLALYFYRLAGFALFLLIKNTALFFFFPNVFELFFIFELVRARYFSRFEWTKRRMVLVVFLIFLIKLPIEYSLHVRYFDLFSLLRMDFLSLIRLR
jgi:hypothetical protein